MSGWITASRPAIDRSIVDEENAHWRRYGGTWFAGVNVLPNDENGAVPDGPALAGEAVGFISQVLGFPELPWDRAQVSVCYPGYPHPMSGESDAVFAFRRDRDAAHIDGLLKEGVGRRRYLREHHAFILGIPITDHHTDAAPFTIWEGSHRIIQDWLRRTFEGLPPERWGTIDLTESYKAVRRNVFDTCRRVTISARPGEAYLAHRHAVHGMAPWPPEVTGTPDGRIIVYFRPAHNDLARWLYED